MPWVNQWPLAAPNLAGTFRDIDTLIARALATGEPDAVDAALHAIGTRVFYLELDLADYRRRWHTPQLTFADLYVETGL